MTAPITLRGIGVGGGLAGGPTVRMGRPPELPSERPVTDGDAETELAASALDTVSADLASRSLEATDPTASAVLDAFSMIAADPELRDQVTELIAQRTGPSRGIGRC
jgi:phosphotransferase system enzyme I (PtsI)